MIQRGLISLLSTSTTVNNPEIWSERKYYYFALSNTFKQQKSNVLVSATFCYITNHQKIKCLKTQDSVSW